jgi:hypothetical protein
MASVAAPGAETVYRHEPTDAEGSFVIGDLPPGELRLAAQSGAEVLTRPPEPLAAGMRRSLALTLEPGTWLSGTVAHPDGTPAPQVRVEASPPPDGFGLYAVGLSDDSGHFSVGPVGEGMVTLRLRSPGGGLVRDPSGTDVSRVGFTLPVRAGSPPTGLSFIAGGPAVVTGP